MTHPEVRPRFYRWLGLLPIGFALLLATFNDGDGFLAWGVAVIVGIPLLILGLNLVLDA
jgi:hypothetical protein